MSEKIFTGKLDPNAKSIAVIMAGGSGTRFWPSSRKKKPKQFLTLAGSERSLIQATFDRLHPLVESSSSLVVTAANQAHLVREDLPEVSVLSEPSARNTAACVGFAAMRVLQEVGDVALIVLPADHVILEEENLRGVLSEAVEIASKEDVLLTLGIKPTAPETGYGYILAGDSANHSVGSARNVEAFVEKPDRETAERYLSEATYYWNSGMFVWRASVILSAIKETLPELYSKLEQIAELSGKEDEFDQTAEIYSTIESVSVDVGVMERANNVAMLAGDSLGWSDVGSWDAWADCAPESATSDAGNVTKGDTMLVGSKNCVSVSNGRFVAGVGLEDIIIVETADSVLVCHRNAAQDVKKIVSELQEQKREDLL